MNDFDKKFGRLKIKFQDDPIIFDSTTENFLKYFGEYSNKDVYIHYYSKLGNVVVSYATATEQKIVFNSDISNFISWVRGMEFAIRTIT
jgi:hypothetical protein